MAGDDRKRQRVDRFEDLLVWQKARTWVRQVYQATNEGTFSRDFGLRDQLRKAAVSVMPNVAEGFERGGSREFCRFVSIAKGSCGEARSQLYVALDVAHLTEAQFDSLLEQAAELGRMLGGLHASLARYP